MRVKYDTDTKIYFQIGDPLDHACAAFISNSMYELANINAQCLLLTVKKGQLAKFCDMVKSFGISGFDITMPHKTDIIPFLDECEEFSRIFESVNHVKVVDGKLIGIGLDGVGVRMSLEKEGVKLDGARVLMLGAGSVAGPIAAEICKKGVKSVTILNRTVEKAKHVTEILKQHFDVETAYGEMTAENMERCAKESTLVIQCTSLGMYGSGHDFESVDFVEKLPKGAVVADVLFNPPRTKLLRKAESLGYQVINGMGMLTQQQQATMKFHFGIDLPDSCFREAEESLMVAMALREFRQEHLED